MLASFAVFHHQQWSRNKKKEMLMTLASYQIFNRRSKKKWSEYCIYIQGYAMTSSYGLTSSRNQKATCQILSLAKKRSLMFCSFLQFFDEKLGNYHKNQRIKNQIIYWTLHFQHSHICMWIAISTKVYIILKLIQSDVLYTIHVVSSFSVDQMCLYVCICVCSSIIKSIIGYLEVCQIC